MVEPARGFFGRSVRRAGADFLVLIIASKVGPAQMGPIVRAEGWGRLCTVSVSGHDLSQLQPHTAWHSYPGSQAGGGSPRGRNQCASQLAAANRPERAGLLLIACV